MQLTVIKALAFSLLLAACAALLPAARGLPGPEALVQPLTRTQMLEAQFGEQSGSLLALTQVQDEQLLLVVTTLMGQPLFTLAYDGKTARIVEKAAEAPRRLRADYVLRDLLWSQWPAATLQGALSKAGYRLQEADGLRQIFQGQTLLLSVRREPNAVLHVSNPQAGYSMTITTLPESAP